MQLVRRLVRQRRGTSSAEYALLLAGIGVALAVSAVVLGQAVATSMGDSGNRVENCGGVC